MTTAVIITISVLLLLAYVFDITSAKTKIPSVLLLLILGWGVKQVTIFLKLPIPDLEPALPILGTIGLILIVMEGSLELELSKSKIQLISKSVVIAFLPILIFSLGLAYSFNYYSFGEIPLKIALSNAIPLSIISSAIAIPSVRNLISHDREFVTYESSLSDILGVIFFNFITLHAVIDATTYKNFFINLFITLFISTISTIVLSFLLSKIKHHVKFIPIVLLIVLIYTISKHYHLPALVLILFFGLFLGNLGKLRRFTIFNRFNTESLEKEVHKFKDLISEGAFLIRALFFLLFGYLIESTELLNVNTAIWAITITIGIFVIRAVHLLVLRLPFLPLFFIAPRGLITILLFLSIPAGQNIIFVNNSLIIQVIVLTSFIMMFGMFQTKKIKPELIPEVIDEINEEESLIENSDTIEN